MTNQSTTSQPMTDQSVKSMATQLSEARAATLMKLFRAQVSGLRTEARFFSAPGRSELVGNHTDHNGGLVIAAAVDLDIAALAQPSDRMRVRLWSHDYRAPIVVELDRLRPLMEERRRSESLIRGIAAEMKRRGVPIGGFDAVIDSQLPTGGGLSSSAAFEMLIVSIFDQFYGQQRDGLGVIARAEIGQRAENDYFDKPSGMMDQLASAHGSILHIDFQDPQHPRIEALSDRFSDWGLQLAIVDTGSSHADLTDEYESVANDMHAIADHLLNAPQGSKNDLRRVSEQRVIEQALALACKYGDRAVLRALHFFGENRRVADMTAALRHSDPQAYLQAMQASGNSSWTLLQNCASSKRPEFQPVALALTLTQHFLDRHIRTAGSNRLVGACRVHGGGFAGAIQVLLETEWIDEYEQYIGRCLPVRPSPVTRLMVRTHGAGAHATKHDV